MVRRSQPCPSRIASSSQVVTVPGFDDRDLLLAVGIECRGRADVYVEERLQVMAVLVSWRGVLQQKVYRHEWARASAVSRLHLRLRCSGCLLDTLLVRWPTSKTLTPSLGYSLALALPLVRGRSYIRRTNIDRLIVAVAVIFREVPIAEYADDLRSPLEPHNVVHADVAM